jgi:hypothetical protein
MRKGILIPGPKVVWRHGSTTPSAYREINSIQSIKNSSDKLLSKQCFQAANVRTAPWCKLSDSINSPEVFKKFLDDNTGKMFMFIVKHRFGSRGNGNYLMDSKEKLTNFINSHKNNLNTYIIEKYMTYSCEYRLHISKLGCFYTCRKMLKNDTPENKKFQRHDDNCVWILEKNEQFNKPANWNDIISDCIKALEGLGGDVFAFDVKTTSKSNSKDGSVNWIIIESCSAPAMGDITEQEYKKHLPLVVKNKYGS